MPTCCGNIACIPSALTAEQRARSTALREELVAATARVDELPDGYRYALRSDSHILHATAEWMHLERLCCPFLDFELVWRRNDQGPSLTLRGAEGVKAFLQAELPVLPTAQARSQVVLPEVGPRSS